jgi:hypothetical protein
MTPSVPKQLAWVAEYDNIPISTLAFSHPGMKTTAAPPPGEMVESCTMVIALSAVTGANLDEFDYCPGS